MNNLLIETKEIGNHRIKIYYDTDNTCPVKEGDMGGCYVFEHLEFGRYWLSSDCNWEEYSGGRNLRDNSMSDILQRMAADVVEQTDIIAHYKAGKMKDVRFIYNRHTRMWELQHYLRWKGANANWATQLEIEPYELKEDADYRMELLEGLEEEDLLAIIQKYAKDFVIKEWSSSGYSQGDHMRGIAYMSKEHFDKTCGFSHGHYKDWKEQALHVIDGEIKSIEMWAWGDVKGYVLERKVPFTKVYADEEREDEEDIEWEEVDSCWGYYMETEELIAEVIAEHDLKEIA